MAENGTGSMWDRLAMQQEPTPQEKELKDKFVTEYLVDYDAWAAAIRVGFLRNIAGTYAQTMLEDTYVRREIARRQQLQIENPKEANKARRRLIEAALMREAHYKGPNSTHAGRVMALANLAKIHDMNAATKIKSEVVHKGGVMRVPAIASVADWEKEAAKTQDKLIKEARH